MVLEFLGQTDIVIFFVIFVIFIVIAYKFVKFIFKAFMVGLVAALFPIFGNFLFGLNIDITLFNIFWFALTGIGLFILYAILKTGWKFLKTITWPFRRARKSGKKK
jgi:hypothetical protein